MLFIITPSNDELPSMEDKAQRREENGTRKRDSSKEDKESFRYSEFTGLSRVSLWSLVKERALEVRSCPHCNVPIEKNGGCDHMYCSKCKSNYNWSGSISALTNENSWTAEYQNDPKGLLFLSAQRKRTLRDLGFLI